MRKEVKERLRRFALPDGWRDALVVWRAEKRMGQQEAAEGIGISQPTLSEWERGVEPSLMGKIRLAQWAEKAGVDLAARISILKPIQQPKPKPLLIKRRPK